MHHSDWKDHIAKRDLVFEHIQEAALKVHPFKSFFGKDAVTYFSYWITHKGIQPLLNNVDALQNLVPPTSKQKLRLFIDLINHYHNMWSKRSHILCPFASLTSKQGKWRRGEVEQKAFNDIKKL
jgi:hypothetical protein